jgi:hypothetical protein
MRKVVPYSVLLLSLISMLPSEAESIGDGVKELDSSNFEQEVANNEYMLVNFYAPWW